MWVRPNLCCFFLDCLVRLRNPAESELRPRLGSLRVATHRVSNYLTLQMTQSNTGGKGGYPVSPTYHLSQSTNVSLASRFSFPLVSTYRCHLSRMYSSPTTYQRLATRTKPTSSCTSYMRTYDASGAKPRQQSTNWLGVVGLMRLVLFRANQRSSCSVHCFRIIAGMHIVANHSSSNGLSQQGYQPMLRRH